VRAGEPISLDLTIRAQDLTAAQLPDLSALLSIPGQLRTYAGQPKLADADQGGSVLGTREQSIALIAAQPGRYDIPALTVSWWDTQARQLRQVSVPARTLTILPAAAVAGAPAAQPAAAVPAPDSGAAAAPAAVPAPGGALPWQLTSAALLCLWLATAGAWAWSRRRSAAAPAAAVPSGPAPAFKERAAFHDACRQHDARAARAHLLAWARQVYGTDAPAGLGALARRLSAPALTPLLTELDRACFAGGADSLWHGEALSRALERLPGPAAAARRVTGLAPLYP
jgi:hypothetical protein